MMPDKTKKTEFEKVYHKLKRDVYGYCLYWANNSNAESEDLFQEACFRLYKGLESGLEIRSLRTYMMSSVRHIGLNHLRMRKRERCAMEVIVERQSQQSSVPKSELMHEEQVQALWKAVDQLSEAQKEVIMMRYMTDLTFREIADVINENESTVTNRCHDAIKKIGNLLSKEI